MTADFSGLDPCVHCGFCLQACPTFLVTGDEADSPRGRIVLMRQMAREPEVARDENLRLHLDRCLGCRGCEPVCPSGVRYGEALESARAVIAEQRPLPLAARLVLTTMAEPNLRAPAMAVARMLRPLARRFAGKSRVGFALGMLGATAADSRFDRPTVRPSDRHPERSEGRLSATVFRGCIMEGLFSHVNAATERTLAVNDYEIVDVPGQGCCGALHAHAGEHQEAQALARANVTAFAATPNAAIAVNSAGCGATLKEYGHLLAGEPLEDSAREMAARVKDVSELLAARGPKPGGPVPFTVAYDPPCHLLHAQRVARDPLTLLDAIPQLSKVTHAEAEICCGSAGIYSLIQPEMSRAVLDRKIQAILAVSPDFVTTGNPGCAMQIGAGLTAAGSSIPVVHPVELLDHSYNGAGLYQDGRTDD